MKYFEDFEVGQVFDLGARSVSADEIIAFARKYDPQPFHTDPEAARSTVFGGLVASGWHTCAIMMSLLSRTIGREGWASNGAPGIDTCRWLLPVRPGDRLTGTMRILDARRSRTKPYGIVRNATELHNQDGAKVMYIEGIALFALRPAAATAEAAT